MSSRGCPKSRGGSRRKGAAHGGKCNLETRKLTQLLPPLPIFNGGSNLIIIHSIWKKAGNATFLLAEALLRSAGPRLREWLGLTAKRRSPVAPDRVPGREAARASGSYGRRRPGNLPAYAFYTRRPRGRGPPWDNGPGSPLRPPSGAPAPDRDG